MADAYDASSREQLEGGVKEGAESQGESSGTVAFIDSVAVQAISSRMKAEKGSQGFLYSEIYDVTKFLVSMSLNVCGVKAGVIPR